MTQPGRNLGSRQAMLFVTAALCSCASPQAHRSKPLDAKTSATGAAKYHEAVRKDLLFSAAAPVPEKALKRLDGTLHQVSFIVPLTVDRTQNRFSVQVKINAKTMRLVLDTGGDAAIGLDETTADGIKLNDLFPLEENGSQGSETDTAGLAQSLTLGNLTLKQAFVTVSPTAPAEFCSLGTQAFKRYRVTLNFQAQTITLTRGGVLKTPPGGASVTLPFDDDDGHIFVPVHVLGQDGWAMLDSGSDLTQVSLKAAKAAAALLPATDSKSDATSDKSGMGNTAKETTVVKLALPIPISLNRGPQNRAHQNKEFGTTSRIGGSDIDDALNSQFGGHGNINVILGFPFLLQFQRVIIDYPARKLVLQYPVKDTPLEVQDFSTGHDRAWPGYQWLQKGYGWIEVPDGSVPPETASPAH